MSNFMMGNLGSRDYKIRKMRRKESLRLQKINKEAEEDAAVAKKAEEDAKNKLESVVEEDTLENVVISDVKT